ncbi:MAG TPA: CoA-transferase [Acidimicrobiia bacterium]|nr:CoA-transferase [Acidimicrobiia bacterium]
MELLTAEQAVRRVPDGATLIVGGSGAGHAVPQAFIDALARVFSTEGHPRDLTTVRVVGLGDFANRGFSQLALPGLMKRTIGSNIGNEPRLGELVERGEIESYSFPQGVLSQLCREIAAGRPGLVTAVGLGTYVDPRQTGGKQGAATEDLVEVVELAGREWLFFRSFPIDVAVIRGSALDEDGNLTMDDEAVRGEMLAMAMAARNSGGIVIAQAKRLAARRTLPARSVVVPGALIDVGFLDPDQTQTYATDHSPYYSGAERRPASATDRSLALDLRKVIARRSLLEFRPGDICNLGFGVSQMIGAVAWEEGIDEQIVLTVEQGIFGGVPAAGNDGGAGFNFQAMIDQPYMFDFYDGGGLDIASLSFAQVDRHGNVNVHSFPGRLRGPGGFPNISARTGRLCFVGTLTTTGLEARIVDQRLQIVAEGSLQKFVPDVDEISFSGRMAAERGQRVRYITERAVFELIDGVVTLVEVAEGFDAHRDVVAHMGFEPAVAEPVAVMDRRVFAEGAMGIASDFARSP